MSAPVRGRGPRDLPSAREARGWADAAIGMIRGEAESAGIAGALCVEVVRSGGHRRVHAPSRPRGEDEQAQAHWRRSLEWSRSQNLAALRTVIGAAVMLSAVAPKGSEELLAHVDREWRVRLPHLPELAMVDVAARWVLERDEPAYRRAA